MAAPVVHREGIDSGRGIAVSDDDDSFDGYSWQLFKSSLDAVALASWGGSGGVNLTAGGTVRYVTGSRVSASYFLRPASLE